MDNYQLEETVQTSELVHGTVKLTDKVKEDALKAVMSRFEGVRKWREKRFEEYTEFEKLYDMTCTGDKDTLSQVMSADGFNSVEDWVALEMDAMFPVDPPFDVEGRKSILKEEVKSDIKKVLRDNMHTTNYEMEHEKVMRQGAKLGTLVAKCPQVIEEDAAIRIVDKDKFLGGSVIKNADGTNMQEQVIEEYIDQEDYVAYKFVPLNKLYFKKNKLTWMIELIDTSWTDLERNKRLYDNLEAAKKTTYPGHTEEDKEAIETIDQDLEVMEAHKIPVPLEIDGKMRTVLCLVYVVNRKEVIRVQPYPYTKLVYLVTQFFENKGVEGIGIIERLKKMLIEINTRRTQALDANTMGLYGMKAVNMRYIKKPEQLRIRKDGLIELKETDKPIEQIIQFYRPPVEYANIANSLLDRISMEVVRTTRLKGVLSGEKITPQPSATEWAGMMKEALKSVKVILRRIAHGQLEEWLERVYIYNVTSRSKSWNIVDKIQIPTPVMGPMGGVELGPDGNPKIMMKEVTIKKKVAPRDIYTEGLEIRAIGPVYMKDEVVMRHQLLQKLDLLTKYANLPLINERGEMVQPDFYKQLQRLMISFGDENPDANFKLLPPPPPSPMTPGPGQFNGVPPKQPNANLPQQTPPGQKIIQGAVQTQ